MIVPNLPNWIGRNERAMHSVLSRHTVSLQCVSCSYYYYYYDHCHYFKNQWSPYELIGESNPSWIMVLTAMSCEMDGMLEPWACCSSLQLWCPRSLVYDLWVCQGEPPEVTSQCHSRPLSLGGTRMWEGRDRLETVCLFKPPSFGGPWLGHLMLLLNKVFFVIIKTTQL